MSTEYISIYTEEGSAPCEELDNLDIPNGKVIFNNSATMVYECIRGFHIRKSSSSVRKCQDDGSWQHATPMCVGKLHFILKLYCNTK